MIIRSSITTNNWGQMVRVIYWAKVVGSQDTVVDGYIAGLAFEHQHLTTQRPNAAFPPLFIADPADTDGYYIQGGRTYYHF